MNLPVILLSLVFVIHCCFAQCSPPVGPSCVLLDSSAGYQTSDYISPEFWQGIGNVFPSGGTVVTVPIQTPGSIAAFDVAANCGFVFFSLGTGSNIFTLGASDIANLQAYKAAGGVFVALCENPGFSPNCPALMNPIISAVDPSSPVVYDATFVNGLYGTCTIPPTTASGLTSGFLTTPNDITTFKEDYANSFIYPTDADPECLVGSFDVPGKCSLAVSGQFLFLTDINTIYTNSLSPAPCDNPAPYVTDVGENVGSFIAACGGTGGDPHVFSFSGKQLPDVEFQANKQYEFYGCSDFRVVVQTQGTESRMFITAIGVAISENQLLATIEDNEPVFYFNGVRIVDEIHTPLGTAKVFTPDAKLLSGSLAEESRYLTIGLSLHTVEIVGGIRPGFGGFFNLAVRKNPTGREFGLLPAVSRVGNTVRDSDFVAQFETSSLF